MLRQSDVTIDLVEADQEVVRIEISTPIGRLEITGNIRVVGRVLYVVRTHIYGMEPGLLGRAGLNAIGRRLLEVADVDRIVIQGGTRATGRMVGRDPRTITFPHP